MSDAPEDRRVDLSDLYADREAPSGQEARVMEAYRAQYASRRSGVSPWIWARRVAVWVILFGSGFATASRFPSTPSADAGERFMFIMWEGPGFGGGAPGVDFSAEYAAWADVVRGEGVTLEGSELAPTRSLVRHGVGSGPSEPARVGGYFIVSSPDFETARRLAEGHPHLNHGGWIEVAPLR